MTRRIPLLLMALLTSIFCAAAQADPEFDSLQNRYRTLRDDPSRNPEELAETCADLSEYYCYRSVDSAIRYARLGLDEVGDSRSPARAMLLNNLAVPTLMQGDTDRAIELFTQAGEIAEELGEPEFMLNIYSSLGVCYRMKNDSPRALDHYRKALDIELPDLSGFDLIGHLRSRDPQARIIVNTMHEEIWNIHRLMDCGVNAIILKSANAEELRWAVEAVLGGETYFCRRFRRISERTGRTGTELADCSALTQRELDVLRAIAKGYNTGEIAGLLFLSENTIETHRKKLMLKLGARNMAELVVKAISLGIVTV